MEKLLTRYNGPQWRKIAEANGIYIKTFNEDKVNRWRSVGTAGCEGGRKDPVICIDCVRIEWSMRSATTTCKRFCLWQGDQSPISGFVFLSSAPRWSFDQHSCQRDRKLWRNAELTMSNEIWKVPRINFVQTQFIINVLQYVNE